MKIAFACDHAGFEMKLSLMEYLKTRGHELTDLGCYSSESSDFPDFGHLLAQHIIEGKSELGFSLCGTGNGISMVANKHPEIRSALCWNVRIAELARQHNNANICAIPARFLSTGEVQLIADAFLNSAFEGGRHQRRIDKIPIP